MKLELSLDQKDHYLNKCNIILEDESLVENCESEPRYVLCLEVLKYNPTTHGLKITRDFADYGDFDLLTDFNNVPTSVKEVIISILQEKIDKLNGK